MATRNKKLVALALVGAMTIGVIPAQVQAASSASGKLGGVAVSAYVNTDSDSATATTICYGSGATRYAKATVYYWFGTEYKKNSASNSSTSSAGVTAIATKGDGGGEVKGGKGVHKVTYGNYTWSPTTTTGTTW